jgi:hypothetical protein
LRKSTPVAALVDVRRARLEAEAVQGFRIRHRPLVVAATIVSGASKVTVSTGITRRASQGSLAHTPTRIRQRGTTKPPQKRDAS